jgi:hypothetical protein
MSQCTSTGLYFTEFAETIKKKQPSYYVVTGFGQSNRGAT